MTQEEMKAKIEALRADTAFLEKLQALTEPAEIAAELTAQGVEVTADDVLEAMASVKTGELDAAELDGVAGGFNINKLNPFYWLGYFWTSAGLKKICK